MSRADSLLSRMTKEMRLSEDAYPPPGVVLAYMKDHAKEWNQFAANMKAAASAQEVAALLGHRSIRTARRHYAPRCASMVGFQG